MKGKEKLKARHYSHCGRTRNESNALPNSKPRSPEERLELMIAVYDLYDVLNENT